MAKVFTLFLVLSLYKTTPFSDLSTSLFVPHFQFIYMYIIRSLLKLDGVKSNVNINSTDHRFDISVNFVHITT